MRGKLLRGVAVRERYVDGLTVRGVSTSLFRPDVRPLIGLDDFREANLT
jgi:hypothetical protein